VNFILASFASRIRECRTSRKLTQKQIAALFGLSERIWQDYEGGKRTPTFDGLIALADYFDCSLDYLVGRSDDPARR
jgi:transcriptional regulator with XRE-family HTH domain